MGKWNEEAAPNNNLASDTMKYSGKKKKEDIVFSEELSDGGERNEIIEENES